MTPGLKVCLVDSFPGCSSRAPHPGGFNSEDLAPLSPGGWKPKIQVGRAVPSEAVMENLSPASLLGS